MIEEEADRNGWALVLDAANDRLAGYYGSLGFRATGPASGLRRIGLAVFGRADTHARRNLVAEPCHRRLARNALHGQRALSRCETLALRGLPRYGNIVPVHYLASHAEDAGE